MSRLQRILSRIFLAPAIAAALSWYGPAYATQPAIEPGVLGGHGPAPDSQLCPTCGATLFASTSRRTKVPESVLAVPRRLRWYSQALQPIPLTDEDVLRGDINQDGTVDSHDASILYYVALLPELLEDDNAFATVRTSLLSTSVGSGRPINDTEFGRLVRGAKLVLERNPGALDVNRDGVVDDEDALILYYTFAVDRMLIGDGVAGGKVNVRQTFFGKLLRDIENPDDDDIREAMIRSNWENFTSAEWDALIGRIKTGYENTEFRQQWGLGTIKASIFYARLKEQRDLRYTGPAFELPAEGMVPGAGVTVAFIDSGLDVGHWEFRPVPGSAETLPGAPRRVSSEIAPGQVVSSPSRVWQHGTEVASIVGAGRGELVGDISTVAQNFHGVAWGSRLRMYTVTLSQDGGNGAYAPLQAGQLAGVDRSDARVFSYAINRVGARPDVVNLSIGYPGLVENYSAMDLRDNYGDAIAALTQATRPDGGKSLLVVSAGNDHGVQCVVGTDNCIPIMPGATVGTINASSPQILAGLPVCISDLRSHMVVVVAVGRDSEITGSSNRCGIAAPWCVAAPGEGVHAALSRFNSSTSTQDNQPYQRGYNTELSGTSAAAAFVSGSLAALMHFFDGQLSNEQVLVRLLQTATRGTPDPVPSGEECPKHLDTDGDRSTCELSSELGWGIINLDKATAPNN